MKRLSVMFALVCSAAAFAQTKDAPPVQAPPTLDDPGAKVALPSPQQQAQAAINDARPSADSREAARPVETQPLPPEVQAAAEASELPVVTVRAQGAETVEEYRKKGKLYFVRVLSSSGPPKFYVDNPQAVPPNVMQQLSGPSGVVQPVYYKLADWK